jgi:hypothetical protein
MKKNTQGDSLMVAGQERLNTAIVELLSPLTGTPRQEKHPTIEHVSVWDAFPDLYLLLHRTQYNTPIATLSRLEADLSEVAPGKTGVVVVLGRRHEVLGLSGPTETADVYRRVGDEESAKRHSIQGASFSVTGRTPTIIATCAAPLDSQGRALHWQGYQFP